ncbi:MAG: type II secretion system secretin GspD [Nitrospirae bacterium]|nr:type II secretion system secretin GspD [Nitrospirota bacterium]
MKRHYIILIIISLLVTVTFSFAQEEQSPEPPPVPPVNAPPEAAPPAPADIVQPAVPNQQPGAPRHMPRRVQPGEPEDGAEQLRSSAAAPKEENYIILNFDNADLRDVINTVGTITKENFIISPGVDARITIHSAKKIPVSEVMNVFESVLEVNGISIVRSGEFFKVVPGASAKQKPLEIKKGNKAEDVAAVDRMITQIVPVEFVPVNEINTVITPLLSQFGSVIPNSRNNILIISDLSSNIKRLLVILEEIDVNAFENTRMLFFRPQFSDVSALSEELTEVLNALNITKEGLSIMLIERINSLVIFSSSPSLLEAVEGWLKKLDEEIVSGQNVFIYHVQNVKAENIADILDTLYGEGATKKVAVRRDQPKAAAPAAGQAAAPAAAHAQPARQQAAKEGGGAKVEIITFEPTNSLIILAPPGLYREMAETIRRIDTYPREVLIEGVVAQVTLTDKDEYGVQWSTLQNINIEGNKYNGLVRNSLGDLLTEAPGFNDGLAGGLSVVLFRPDKLTTILNALASRSKVNILQSPRLLVRDQEEATIEVGQEIPTATSTTSSTSTDTLTQSIQYKTVGIKLKIKPTINEEKTVVLDIEQEVSSQGDNVRIGAEGNVFPAFNTTKTKTSIVVPNEHGIIIGGIMDETKNKSYNGIPFLSSIPIIGGLFRYQVDLITKKELVIIITPHVVVTKIEGDDVTSEFIGKLKEAKKYLEEKDIRYSRPPEGKQPALKQ